MIIARPFFDLQLDFARTVATLGALPRQRALLDYTNLYIRFGLGRAFDGAHPVWRAYLDGLEQAPDAGDWTHRFYVTRGADGAPPLDGQFGCFAYARLGADRIRLHFANADDGHSPLAMDRRARRRAELAALFAHVRQTIDGDVAVVGASWLYNLDAYRSLFPHAYLATARLLPGRFRHMPLWGQFLDRHGRVKESMARLFRARVGRVANAESLDRCFPFPVIGVQAPVSEFYRFYGV